MDRQLPLINPTRKHPVNPHFSPEGEMIAQRFGFTRDFPKERKTGCISDRGKFLVDSKIKRGLVVLVRNAG
jgi:hypothetical protein